MLVGSEFLVNSYTINDESNPSIAIAAAGDFVVAWERGGAGGGIFARHFSSAGAAVGGAFRVSTYNGILFDPSVAVGPTGDFVVTWTTAFRDGGPQFGSFARLFSGADE